MDWHSLCRATAAVEYCTKKERIYWSKRQYLLLGVSFRSAGLQVGIFEAFEEAVNSSVVAAAIEYFLQQLQDALAIGEGFGSLVLRLGLVDGEEFTNVVLEFLTDCWDWDGAEDSQALAIEGNGFLSPRQQH